MATHSTAHHKKRDPGLGSLQAAREEILKWSGKQFDPDVVKVFLEMPENIWEDLRKEIHAQIYRVAYSSGAKG